MAFVPLVAAAVCPHPPLLVPEVAAGAAGELDELRAACRTALAYVTAAAVDSLIVLGGDTQTVRRTPPYGGTLSPWGLDVPIGDRIEQPLPLSLLIGVWLAPGADILQSVATDAGPEHCVELGKRLAMEDERVGLLVLGDGSARRGEKAPGYADPRAEDFDSAVALALATADTEALLALDVDLAAQLMVAGRAPWQVLAGAADAPFGTAELLFTGAPYGVAYHVASWR